MKSEKMYFCVFKGVLEGSMWSLLGQLSLGLTDFFV